MSLMDGALGADLKVPSGRAAKISRLPVSGSATFY
jgi:hypothetical protein